MKSYKTSQAAMDVIKETLNIMGFDVREVNLADWKKNLSASVCIEYNKEFPDAESVKQGLGGLYQVGSPYNDANAGYVVIRIQPKGLLKQMHFNDLEDAAAYLDDLGLNPIDYLMDIGYNISDEAMKRYANRKSANE